MIYLLINKLYTFLARKYANLILLYFNKYIEFHNPVFPTYFTQEVASDLFFPLYRYMKVVQYVMGIERYLKSI